MIVQDNQQATINWFIGILEGEGNFVKGINRQSRVMISNTNICIIKECENFLKNNFILYKTYADKEKENRKQRYTISISCQDCYNLYKLISNKMECRLQEFQKILGASETTRNISTNINWLTGIFQAEGSFTLLRLKDRIRPSFRLDNTNSKIILKFVLTLKEIGCSWSNYFRPAIDRKPIERITIEGLSRCKLFLNKTKNLWIGERDILRTSLIEEFINNRIYKGFNHLPYTARELEIHDLIKELNHRGK